MPLNEKQRTRFGVEWILKASEKKAGKSLEVRLAKEMVSVIQGSSEALKKKEEVHKAAMLNRCAAYFSLRCGPCLLIYFCAGEMLLEDESGIAEFVCCHFIGPA